MLVPTPKHTKCVAILLELVSNQRDVQFGHKYPDIVKGRDISIIFRSNLTNFEGLTRVPR
jgi:hypothetical protein